MTQNCGKCMYWDSLNKRNISNPKTPVWRSDCRFPTEDMKIPHCVAFEETGDLHGTSCPCFSSVIGAGK